ncbi:MAG: site-2 protease family protein [Candidatus Limnocylindrales bacterium]|jgi:Zn-dependent protease
MAITVRVLGFPITIGLAFPAFLLLLGYISRFAGIYLAIWVVFGTAAILLHELGHALAFRRYGLESSIRFWTLGGLAVPNDQEAAAKLPDRQMLVVALAGPCVGLVLGAAGLALEPVVAGQSPDVRFAVGMWIFVNMGWGIFNLLPIAGLDGGHVLMHLTMVALGERGRVIALGASIVSSALVAALAIETGYLYIAAIAILFGLANPYQYRALLDALFPGRAERRRQRDAESSEPLSRRHGFEDDPGPAWPDGDDREPGS